MSTPPCGGKSRADRRLDRPGRTWHDGGMTRPGSTARRLLAGMIVRLAGGGGLAPEEVRRLRSEIPLAGFRGALRALLLRRWLGPGPAGAGPPVLVPALGGRFELFVPAADHGVGARIAEDGVWEPHVAAALQSLIEPGDSVVDVGANLGFHALLAAILAGPEGRVTAVEPDPANARMLRMSVRRLRGAAPVEVVEAALWDRSGELTFSDLGNPGNSGARFVGDRERLEVLVHGEAPRFGTVRAVRWDEAFFDVPMQLLKLDVEGAEPVVVRGMARSIERWRPVILTELAPGNLRQIGHSTAGAYLAWFTERGYVAYRIAQPVPVRLKDGADPRAGGHHADLMLLPADRETEVMSRFVPERRGS